MSPPSNDLYSNSRADGSPKILESCKTALSDSTERIKVPFPPPAYDAMPSILPLTATTFSAYSSLSDSEGSDSNSEDERFDQLPKPITIDIDASILVSGHSNTVLLPPNPSAIPNHHTAQPSPKAEASPLLPTRQQQRASHTSSTTTEGDPPSRLASIQQARASRLASLIFAALKHAGAFEAGNDTRPVNVRLNAGVQVKGAGNLVAMGGLRIVGRKDADVGSSATSAASKPINGGAGTSMDASGYARGSKRRAASEPLESPSSKKTREEAL